MVENRYKEQVSISEDLRSTLGHLVSNFRSILIAASVSFIFVTALDVVFGPTYQSSALVSVSEPDVFYMFEPRIVTEMDVPTGDGLAQLAVSDEVLSNASITVEGDSIKLLRDFEDSLEINVSESFLQLTVKSSESTTAIDVANAWAEALVEIVNQLFDETLEDRNFYRDQEADAKASWLDAQQAIAAFQSSNPQIILRQKLSGVQSEISAYVLADQLLGTVIEDAQAIKARLSSRDGTASVGPRDEFAFLLLVARSQLSSLSLSTADGPGGGQPITREPGVVIDLAFTTVANVPEGSITVQEELEGIEAFIASVQGQRTAAASKAAEAEVEIYDLQTRLSTADAEMNRLASSEQLAKEEFLAVARKSNEAELASEGQSKPAAVASLAMEPAERIDSPALLIGGAAFLLGLIASSIWILTIGWWHEDRGAESKRPPTT